jgi:hypothetical protein
MASVVPDVAALSEKKKLAFRSYLEAAGVLDTLVRGKCYSLVCYGQSTGRTLDNIISFIENSDIYMSHRQVLVV